MATPPSASTAPAPSSRSLATWSWVSWAQSNPGTAAGLAALLAVLVWFFGVAHLYAGLSLSHWIWLRWLPGYGMEHGKFVPLVSLFLIWHHRRDLAASVGRGRNAGMWVILLGLLLFLVGARALQARVALFSLPTLLLGVALYLWGWRTFWVLVFPISFLVFMFPLAALEQYTFRLQFLITNSVGVLANAAGIHVTSLGTSLRASDSAFAFEVDDGCSGIRSLFALTMLTALFVHFTQRSLWKQWLIFFMSIPFAIIGNVGRILTILLCAKWLNPSIAGGLYHDYSAFLVALPFSIGAMLCFSKLLKFFPDRLTRPAVASPS